MLEELVVKVELMLELLDEGLEVVGIEDEQELEEVVGLTELVVFR